MDVLCDPISIHSLRKSRARRAILKYLVGIYPNSSYASEIARCTKLGANEVYGALNGVTNRYKKEHSLVALNLARRERKGPISVYSATDLGYRTCRFIAK